MLRRNVLWINVVLNSSFTSASSSSVHLAWLADVCRYFAEPICALWLLKLSWLSIWVGSSISREQRNKTMGDTERFIHPPSALHRTTKIAAPPNDLIGHQQKVTFDLSVFLKNLWHTLFFSLRLLRWAGRQLSASPPPTPLLWLQVTSCRAKQREHLATFVQWWKFVGFFSCFSTLMEADVSSTFIHFPQTSRWNLHALQNLFFIPHWLWRFKSDLSHSLTLLSFTPSCICVQNSYKELFLLSTVWFRVHFIFVCNVSNGEYINMISAKLLVLGLLLQSLLFFQMIFFYKFFWCDEILKMKDFRQPCVFFSQFRGGRSVSVNVIWQEEKCSSEFFRFTVMTTDARVFVCVCEWERETKVIDTLVCCDFTWYSSSDLWCSLFQLDKRSGLLRWSTVYWCCFCHLKSLWDETSPPKMFHVSSSHYSLQSDFCFLYFYCNVKWDQEELAGGFQIHHVWKDWKH